MNRRELLRRAPAAAVAIAVPSALLGKHQPKGYTLPSRPIKKADVEAILADINARLLELEGRA